MTIRDPRPRSSTRTTRISGNYATSSSLVLPCLAFHRAADRSTVLFRVQEKRPIAGADVDEVLANKTILPTARGYLLAHDPTSSSTFLYSLHSRRKIDLPRRR